MRRATVLLNVRQRQARFWRHTAVILVQQGEFFNRHQDFWAFDLATGRTRPLIRLRHGFSVRGFDLSSDGKQILFDRIRENSDIMLIELAR